MVSIQSVAHEVCSASDVAGQICDVNIDTSSSATARADRGGLWFVIHSLLWCGALCSEVMMDQNSRMNAWFGELRSELSVASEQTNTFC